MKSYLRKHPFVVLALLGLFGIASGAVYGYFSTTGTGGGGTTLSNLQTVTISAAVATPTAHLLPGASADAAFKVSNPNDINVKLVSVVGNGAITVSGGGGGCTAGNSGVSFIDQTGLSVTIAKNSTNVTVNLSGAVTMATSSGTSCQSATFTIPILITVHSS